MEHSGFRNLDVFLQVFPFTDRYLPKDDCWGRPMDFCRLKPRLTALDLDLLDRRGNTFWWSWRNCCQCCQDDVSFTVLDRSGVKLCAPLRSDYVSRGWFRFGSRKVLGETVREAICQLPDPDQVGYVLEVGSGPFWVSAVILHKVPESVPYSDWISEAAEDRRRRLRQRLDLIDGVEARQAFAS